MENRALLQWFVAYPLPRMSIASAVKASAYEPRLPCATSFSEGSCSQRLCWQSALPSRPRSPPSRSRSQRGLPPRSLSPRSPRWSSTAMPTVRVAALQLALPPSHHRPPSALAELLDKVESWSVDCVAQWLENLGFRA